MMRMAVGEKAYSSVPAPRPRLTRFLISKKSHGLELHGVRGRAENRNAIATINIACEKEGKVVRLSRAVSGDSNLLLSRLLGAPVNRTVIQLKEKVGAHSLCALGGAPEAGVWFSKGSKARPMADLESCRQALFSRCTYLHGRPMAPQLCSFRFVSPAGTP
jgi:hypothetical protein